MRGKVKEGLESAVENFTSSVSRLQGGFVVSTSESDNVHCTQQLAR